MKNILKKEISKADTEINRDQTIIKEYKQVSSYKVIIKQKLEADRSTNIIDKNYILFYTYIVFT